jgi:hypothetical protein
LEQVQALLIQLTSTEKLLNTWLLAQHKHSTLHAFFCTKVILEHNWTFGALIFVSSHQFFKQRF